VLLVKRKFEPRVGMWTLPAGFMEADEDAVSCAIREAKEETNLDVEVIRLFDVYAAFDDPRTAVVLVLYLVRRSRSGAGGELKCGDDASDAQYFDLNDLPEAIAFRAHRSALADIKKQYAAGLL
jgi:8-oxo-dGTP diphosphatase